MNTCLITILLCSIFFLGSLYITDMMRGYSIRNNILDHPNDRSLHAVPVPRGGGIAITIPLLVMVNILWGMSFVSTQFYVALQFGGIAVAAIGWLDDRQGMHQSIRAATYLFASVWAVLFISYGNLDFSTTSLLVILLAITGVAWLTNLYNFMDGSDGLAALQAISACIFPALLLPGLFETGLSILLAMIAVTSAGFLVYNWPPARIFMGDVGSCFLGFLFGAIVYECWVSQSIPLSFWLILLSVFICDASLTLLMRVFSGEQWWQAHRQHAYQRFIQLGNSHSDLLKYYLLLTFSLSYPLSYVAFTVKSVEWIAVIVNYFILAGIWLIVQIKYRKSAEI